MISHDTEKFIFKLPSDDHVMGLPVGGHVFFHMEIDGEVLSRKYTPVSHVNLRGRVEFVIKVYKPNEEFTEGGKMSQRLSEMRVGDKIKMEGPKGLLSYEGYGRFLIRKKPVMKNKIGLIAGGTGITPILQLIQASTLSNDGVPIVMLYSNKTIDDILVKDELD